MLQSAVSQGPQERERFNEVGLAGAVGADEDVDGPDLKALQGADALEAFDCYVTQGWHGGSLRRSGDGAAGTDQILVQRLAAGKSSGDARTIGGSSYPNGAGRVGPCDSRVLEPAGQVTAAEPDAGEDRGRRRDANGNGGHHDGAGGAHWSEFEGLSGGGQGWRDGGGWLVATWSAMVIALVARFRPGCLSANRRACSTRYGPVKTRSITAETRWATGSDHLVTRARRCRPNRR